MLKLNENLEEYEISASYLLIILKKRYFNEIIGKNPDFRADHEKSWREKQAIFRKYYEHVPLDEQPEPEISLQIPMNLNNSRDIKSQDQLTRD